jgi:hypothetical protein
MVGRIGKKNALLSAHLTSVNLFVWFFFFIAASLSEIRIG